MRQLRPGARFSTAVAVVLCCALTGCLAPRDQTPPGPAAVVLTLDSDGVAGTGIAGRSPSARVLVYDAAGRLRREQQVDGSGTAHVTPAGDGFIATGRDGIWAAPGADEAQLAARADLGHSQTQLFDVAGRSVAFLNVGYAPSGAYLYRIVVAERDGSVRTLDVPKTVQTVGRCSSALLVIATDEASDHYRLPHTAYTFDPATMSLKPVARWTPTTPTLDAFMSYSECGDRGLISLGTTYTVAGGKEEARANVLDIITPEGKRRTIPLKGADGAPPAAYLPASRRTTTLIGDTLYWVGDTSEMTRHFVFASSITSGTTRRLYEITAPGSDPRQQVSATQGRYLVSVDQPAGGGALRMTLRTVVDGTPLIDAVELEGLTTDDLDAVAPVTAVVFEKGLPTQSAHRAAATTARPSKD